jgi:hypothetical protein
MSCVCVIQVVKVSNIYKHGALLAQKKAERHKTPDSCICSSAAKGKDVCVYVYVSMCVCFMCYAGLAGGAFQALAKTCLHFTCSPFCSPFV